MLTTHTQNSDSSPAEITGGVIYIGVSDNPRTVTGVEEREEQISNIIHDNCEPVILPEISFVRYHEKSLIKVEIYRGYTPPYHMKNKPVNKSTYIRVGSSNRLATEEIINELNRKRINQSFDSEVVFILPVEKIDLDGFKKFFKQKTGEPLNNEILTKMELTRLVQNQTFPLNALILMSDDEIKKQLFPYAKIECARFKGNKPGHFIDRKTFESSIAYQPEQAYNFILTHISQASVDYSGVYRKDRWEYPVLALREAVRNAVIHRDYSITGSDIKIAIFDHSIEITSPGKLPPTIDFNDMLSGQSSIRNKTLAPVFKKLGIIEQWGNGLQIIANELKAYPEIELKWSEPGLFFRLSFIRKNYLPDTSKEQELQQELQQGLQQELQQETLFSKVFRIIAEKPLSRKEISMTLGQKSISGQLNEVLSRLMENELIERTIKDKPTSSKQKFKISQKGIGYFNILKKKK
jgi:ATP-dependent DNA helicase RecG